jgi:hypothetical protein
MVCNKAKLYFTIIMLTIPSTCIILENDRKEQNVDIDLVTFNLKDSVTRPIK